MTRARDLADTQENLGGPVPPVVAGKNMIINGGMDIWQRGTSFTTDAAATVIYTADRISAWALFPGNGATQTITRETSASHIPPNFRYSLKSVVSNAVPTNPGRMGLGYTMENHDSLALAGRTITYSMQVKAVGNIDRIYLYSRYNTSGGTALSGATDAANAFFTINSSGFTTITWTTTVPSATTMTSSGTYGLQLVYYRANGVAEAVGDGIYITGIQAEVGSVATPFSRAGGTLQGELAACQRYYWRTSNSAVNNASLGGTGFNYSTTNGAYWANNPVPMRIPPTAIDAANLRVYDIVGAALYTATATISTDSTTINPVFVYTISGGTANRVTRVDANSTGGYLGFSAEL